MSEQECQDHQSRRAGLMKRVRGWYETVLRTVAPGARAWRGAGWGALVTWAVIALVTAHGLFGAAPLAWFLIGSLLFVAAFALAGGVLTVLWSILRGIPAFTVWTVASAVVLLANLALTALSVPIGVVGVGLGAVAVGSLLGASTASLMGGGWRGATAWQRAILVAGLVLGVTGLIGGGVWLLDDGSPMTPGPDVSALDRGRIEPLSVPDPSQPGPYAVGTLSYGSGEDRYRREYGRGVDLITASVDGSAFVERWSGLRTAYWGFGPQELPLNGRVWYPEGNEGPCPLVLIVHGQHPMHDFSDPGYAYLGELLASRGFIVASVDENFLNLSPLVDLLMLQSLIEPDDLRGWLLLEHLRSWRDWNGDPESIFYRRVDLDEIALIGHSRGGLAVAVAAKFNDLPHYPDDGSVDFDYGFGIRSVAAFAPVDGGYRPAGQEIVLNGVNYLVLQGAHDMDVFTFQGNRQYSRVSLHDGGEDLFKAAVYIQGANHGQFNTTWGRKDLFEPVMRVFNLEQLLPGEEQRQIAKVTMTAFLEATLREESEYRALFQDLRRGQAWLPETVYVHQYEDSATRLVSTFEEDVDLTSASLEEGRLMGEGLTLWCEQPLQAKWEDLGSQAVTLGWDAAETAGTASYAVDLPEGALTLNERSVLVFSLADADRDPTPETKKREDEVGGAPIDLTVEVTDAAGESARLPLSHFSTLQRQVEGKLGKAAVMSPFPDSEAILQHFEFPLDDFRAQNADFEPAKLVGVRLIFDRTQAGVVVMDNIGFRN